MRIELPPGVEKENLLREGGFSNEEILNWRAETSRALIDGGFKPEEVDGYFGIKDPDMSEAKKYVQNNLAPLTGTPPPTPPPSIEGPIENPAASGAPPKEWKPTEAKSVLEAFEAGLGMSVSGLFINGRMPEQVLPEHADMALKIANQVGMMAGDLPAIIGGITSGGAAGSVVPVVGTVVGAGAGAMAAPAAIRQLMVDQYTKGDITTFEDFWARLSAITIEGAKGAVIGGATAGAGKLIGPLVSKAAPVVKTSAQLGAEIATMTTVGKAMEGEMPNLSDFVESAIVVGGLHGAGVVVKKTGLIYKATGVHPAEVALAAKNDPVLMGELATKNKDIPASFEPLVDKSVELPKKTSVDVGNGVTIEMTPSEARAKILEKVKSSAETKGEPLSADRIIEDTIDGIHPFKTLERVIHGVEKAKKIPIEEGVYGLGRLMAGHEGRVQAWLEVGPINFKTRERTGTRGINQILREMGPEGWNEYRSYSLALKSLDDHAKGMPTIMDVATAKAAIKDVSPKTEAHRQEMLQFRNETLDMLVDSGVIERAKAETWKKDAVYVPMHRLIEGEAPGAKAGKARNVKDPIKAKKGSELDVIDPIETIVKDTAAFIKLAEKNRLLQNIGKLYEKNPEAAEAIGLRKKDAQLKVVEVKPEEIKRGTGIEVPEGFEVFRKDKQFLGENEIAFFRDGKREVWEVPADVKRALDHMDNATAGWFLRGLGFFSKSLKKGVSLSPDFLLRNFVRDQWSTYTVSKNGTLPVWDAVKGAGEILNKGEAFQKWMYEGGANSAFSSFDMKSLSMDMAKLDQQTGFKSRVWNSVEKVQHAADLMAALSENSTRIGEFQRAMGKGKSAAQAAFESRDLIDFAKVGAKLRAANSVIAYMNAKVQGQVRLVEGLKEDPVGVGTRIMASTVIPTMLLWWAQKDDPRYQETPPWIKDNFHVIFTDDWRDVVDETNLPPADYMTRMGPNGKMQVNMGVPYRIPMSQDVAVVSALVRRSMDGFFRDNPDAFKEFEKTLMATADLPYMPNAVSPILEQISNHSFFTDRPLVPHALMSQLPDQRYTPYTTESAKLVGKLIGRATDRTVFENPDIAAPIVIENYIRQWGGTTAMYAMQLIDKALIESGTVEDPIKPATKWYEDPFFKAFTIRYPTASAESIENFRKEYESVAMYAATIKARGKAGDITGLEEQLDRAEANEKLDKLDFVKKALDEWSGEARRISISKAYSADEKRQMLDGIYYGMIEVARAANKELNESKKLLKLDKNKSH